MKNTLLNYKLKNAEETTDLFLVRLGVPISKSPDGHNMVSVRLSPFTTIVFYGFKTMGDCQAMINFLIDNNIEYEFDDRSVGARYPFHIIIKK